MNILKVGDTVKWRGCFGSDNAENAVIESIQQGAYSGDKDGVDVDGVLWSDFTDRDYIVTLTNGFWAWAYQIDKI